MPDVARGHRGLRRCRARAEQYRCTDLLGFVPRAWHDYRAVLDPHRLEHGHRHHRRAHEPRRRCHAQGTAALVIAIRETPLHQGTSKPSPSWLRSAQSFFRPSRASTTGPNRSTRSSIRSACESSIRSTLRRYRPRWGEAGVFPRSATAKGRRTGPLPASAGVGTDSGTEAFDMPGATRAPRRLSVPPLDRDARGYLDRTERRACAPQIFINDLRIGATDELATRDRAGKSDAARGGVTSPHRYS